MTEHDPNDGKAAEDEARANREQAEHAHRKFREGALLSASDLFNEDGSINQDAVQAIVELGNEQRRAAEQRKADARADEPRE